MHFRFESRVPTPLKVAFAFHKNPGALALLHAGWDHLRVLRHPQEIRIGAETWVEQLVAGFIPVVLGFRHHVYDPPFLFGEEMIHGPFSRFVHLHQFAEENGETVISDILEVQWPWQYGGNPVLRGIIAPQLRLMFQRRAEALLRLCQEGRLTGGAPENQPIAND